MPTAVAAMVNSGIARLLTTLAMNLMFSRQSRCALCGASAGCGGVGSDMLARGSSVELKPCPLDQPQSRLRVTGSDSTSRSCSLVFGASHLALYLPTGSCNWYAPGLSWATTSPLALTRLALADAGLSVPVTISATAACDATIAIDVTNTIVAHRRKELRP